MGGEFKLRDYYPYVVFVALATESGSRAFLCAATRSSLCRRSKWAFGVQIAQPLRVRSFCCTCDRNWSKEPRLHHNAIFVCPRRRGPSTRKTRRWPIGPRLHLCKHCVGNIRSIACEQGAADYENESEKRVERLHFFTMQYRFLSPRTKILPSLTAALARLSSPISFDASTSSLSPSFNT